MFDKDKSNRFKFNLNLILLGIRIYIGKLGFVYGVINGWVSYNLGIKFVKYIDGM